jgi:hypothetical protein
MPKDLIELARQRKLVNRPAPDSHPEAAPEPEADNGDDLSKLLKAELVERAEAAGVDAEGLTKAELLEALEGA